MKHKHEWKYTQDIRICSTCKQIQIHERFDKWRDVSSDVVEYVLKQRNKIARLEIDVMRFEEMKKRGSTINRYILRIPEHMRATQIENTVESFAMLAEGEAIVVACPKEIDIIPIDNVEFFMRCRECGGYFDKRTTGACPGCGAEDWERAQP